MAKYENLKEEIEYNFIPETNRSSSPNDLKIFLRDPLNKTIELLFDTSKIKKIKDLKEHVNI